MCFWCVFVFVFCFLFFVFRFLHSKCDKGSGLCIGPLPVYFCGHYSFGPCTSQLINLICNMLGNMLNDLAEAIRRWTEKNLVFDLLVVPVWALLLSLLSVLLFCGSFLSCLPFLPRELSCLCWSSLHPGVLVPPSGYLVAAVTAQLPCFYARMVALCFPSVIRFMATKDFCPELP